MKVIFDVHSQPLHVRGVGDWFQIVVAGTHTHTHTAGSKLRCQTPTTHTKIITSNFSQARLTLPEDGSQTIRNIEYILITNLMR